MGCKNYFNYTDWNNDWLFWLVRLHNQNSSAEPRVHVYLKTLKKTNIYSEKFLNLKDCRNKIFNENYQSAQKPNQVLEYMLKGISSKIDPNLLYSEERSYLIGEVGNFKDFYERRR